MVTNIGQHRVQSGSLVDGLEGLMAGAQADVFYSDPPWGEGMLKYFETLRMKQVGDLLRTDTPFSVFMECFWDSVNKFSKNIIFIEYGLKWESMILEGASLNGLKHHKTIKSNYNSGSKKLPSHLHLFSKHGIDVDPSYLDIVTGLSGINLVKSAIHPFAVSGGILLDPCCGMGLSADAAMSYGMRFYGCELNPKRLDKTIARIS